MSDSMETGTQSRPLPRWDRRVADSPSPPIRIRPGRDGHPTGKTLSAALIAMLGQRVKVTFTNGPRWMSGYDAVVLVLRNRAFRGDMKACQLLTDLMKCAGLIETEAFDGQGSIAPQTPAEKELADAFVERTLARTPDGRRPTSFDAAPEPEPNR